MRRLGASIRPETNSGGARSASLDRIAVSVFVVILVEMSRLDV